MSCDTLPARSAKGELSVESKKLVSPFAVMIAVSQVMGVAGGEDAAAGTDEALGDEVEVESWGTEMGTEDWSESVEEVDC